MILATHGILKNSNNEKFVATPFIAIDLSNPLSYPGSGIDLFDISGNDRDAILYNGVEYTVSDGGALILDGSNDYALFANNIMKFTENFSASVWVKFNTTSSAQILVYDANYINDLNYGWTLRAVNDTMRITTWNGALFDNLITGSILAINTWMKIGFSRSMTEGTKIFKNGVTVLQDGNVPPTIGTTTTHFSAIAAFLYGTGPTIQQYLNGRIGEVLIYNRALSEA